VALLTVQENLNFLQSTMYGFGSSLGFTLVMIIFAGIRERLTVSQVPAAFSGIPIAFITAGLLSMAFMGFSGLSFK
jgi:electron transport complex protein RnfA